MAKLTKVAALDGTAGSGKTTLTGLIVSELHKSYGINAAVIGGHGLKQKVATDISAMLKIFQRYHLQYETIDDFLVDTLYKPNNPGKRQQFMAKVRKAFDEKVAVIKTLSSLGYSPDDIVDSLTKPHSEADIIFGEFPTILLTKTADSSVCIFKGLLTLDGIEDTDISERLNRPRYGSNTNQIGMHSGAYNFSTGKYTSHDIVRYDNSKKDKSSAILKEFSIDAARKIADRL